MSDQYAISVKVRTGYEGSSRDPQCQRDFTVCIHTYKQYVTLGRKSAYVIDYQLTPGMAKTVEVQCDRLYGFLMTLFAICLPDKVYIATDEFTEMLFDRQKTLKELYKRDVDINAACSGEDSDDETDAPSVEDFHMHLTQLVEQMTARAKMIVQEDAA